MPKVVATVEARMESSRLPGKMLMSVNGTPAIVRLLRRLALCRRVDEIVLATAVSSSCDVLEEVARGEGVKCFRGSEDDVLQRVVDAQRSAESDIVVEINGDCILLDPDIVDMGVLTFLENDCDVVSNCRKPGYPSGFGVQVFRFADLDEVAKTIDDPPVREHVSLYFYEHPEKYRCIHLYPTIRHHAPDKRFQLDYQEDLDFINAIYERLEPRYGDAFGLDEIMKLLADEPHLYDLNQHCLERSAR